MRDKFKQENGDEAEIDFEVLQARTLRELEAFARNALYNVRVPKSFPVAASLAQQTKRSSLSGTGTTALRVQYHRLTDPTGRDGNTCLQPPAYPYRVRTLRTCNA